MTKSQMSELYLIKDTLIYKIKNDPTCETSISEVEDTLQKLIVSFDGYRAHNIIRKYYESTKEQWKELLELWMKGGVDYSFNEQKKTPVSAGA